MVCARAGISRAKGLDFALCLAQLSRRGEGLRDGLSIRFSGKAKVGAVSRLVRLMTTAFRFPAPAAGGGEGTAAKIAQIDNVVTEQRSSTRAKDDPEPRLNQCYNRFRDAA
jgi:hypothetical protein